ncbi:hypothetical protein [Novipirellula artificiosorum]|uniref:DUF4214 domain-containing protein n=1 Tax=Novipirellula artificiosorum TaxID=2528016 RepID=A0A5C6DAA9_9BACT|nr:hypothetical protein [Novipirellula artificiosorum]TWU32647.1 hypothetical protein Poly41_56250 [Novipirellula artificiosorum]
MKNSLDRVLRNNRSPVDPLGYRDAAYPEEEARAVVRLAFVEMMGRDPELDESEHWIGWLRETRSNGDTLRRCLMTTSEFIGRHGYVNPLHFHTWRNSRWLKNILATCSEAQSQGIDWPNARQWNEELIRALKNEHDVQTVAELPNQ